MYRVYTSYSKHGSRFGRFAYETLARIRHDANTIVRVVDDGEEVFVYLSFLRKPSGRGNASAAFRKTYATGIPA